MKANLSSKNAVCRLQCETPDNVVIDILFTDSWAINGGRRNSFDILFSKWAISGSHRNIKVTISFARQLVKTHALEIIGSTFNIIDCSIEREKF